MKLSDIAVSTSRIEDGAWVRAIPDLPGLALKVRGINATAADLVRGRLLRELPEQARRNLSEEDNARINIEVMAQALLLDWNITDDAGAPMPCTADAARAVLSNPKTLLLREAVAWSSRMVALLGAEHLEADAKN